MVMTQGTLVPDGEQLDRSDSWRDGMVVDSGVESAEPMAFVMGWRKQSLPPNPRYERKFVAEGLSLAEALAMVRRHPALFREAFPARPVNNVYFDSPGLRDYFDHINGITPRVKTRVRWYGAWIESRAEAVLEQKIKCGLIGGKVTRKLTALPATEVQARLGTQAPLDCAGLPEAMRSAMGQLRPWLLNRYHRHYFRSADGRLRLTVDSGLEFAGVNGTNGNGVRFAPLRRAVILELKYGLDEVDAAAEAANALPLRLTRCSKYVLGIGRLGLGGR